ncbi:hypothetical protein N0V93_009655 [Gnomoniopsis smithogilvyi]|uniref:Calcineurin-like phosphoesterase domain-containing protein n=1 Tax=Gnomoniopsis smithogilvyi TaxID=1191159 RepID=A0A9W9CTW3_9PEZI|nr:hypothetical protein N0V93_009655 [Gnomoniopsis smithogilvyi]
MLSDTTLRRPKILFAVALLTLCATLFFSYERMKLSAFSLFQEPIPSPTNVSATLTDEEKEAYSSIFDNIQPMSYGTAHRPPMKVDPKNIVGTLPEEYIPGVASDHGSHHAKRLIIIGDVHGHKEALQALLDKLGFNKEEGDTLVFTGDLVNKGPDSAGVVELAMKLGAYSVRGNHEDRVLLAHASIKSQEIDTDAAVAALAKIQIKDGDDDGGNNSGKDLEDALKKYRMGEDSLSKGDERAREVARSLSSEQVNWLTELPVILRIGAIPRGSDKPTFENLLVVHAGLVPNVALEDQDPWAVMNMRTISHPVDELRRDAVRDFLVQRAKRLLSGNRGKLAALQAIDDSMIDRELQKILEAQGLEDQSHEVSLPSSGRDGTYWYEEWSRKQEALVKLNRKGKKDKDKGKEDGTGREPRPITTVVYGHDAKSGLKVPKEYGKGKKGYTFGLDSGCVYGGKLTALVIEVKADEVVHDIVQVDCEQYQAPDE